MTAIQENQEQQYATVRRHLGMYNTRLRAVDLISPLSPSEEIQSLDERIDSLDKISSKLESIGEAHLQQSIDIALETALMERDEYQQRHELGPSYPAEKVIEVMINRHRGKVDVLLPVQQSDLASNSLAKKLYASVEEVCFSLDDPTQFLFEGKYIGFSMDENDVEMPELIQQLRDNAPVELSSPTAALYVRLAPFFSLQYDRTPTSIDIHSKPTPPPIASPIGKVTVDSETGVYLALNQLSTQHPNIKLKGSFVREHYDITIGGEEISNQQLAGFLSSYSKRNK